MEEAKRPEAGRKPPKGGRKGGTLFPKINLGQALEYAKKLVAKTHTGPQPEKTILPGVFGSAGTPGKIRASALKQYGLLEGPVDAYRATKLARDIDATPESDRAQFLQHAFLNSKLFSEIFSTFHGDTVSKAKIEQRARGLNVHPESAVECAELFIDSAVTANLGTVNGDSITLQKAGETAQPAKRVDVETIEDGIEERQNEDSEDGREKEEGAADKNSRQAGSEKPGKQDTRPGVTLTLTVDPSSDPDKLEKQLKLLRQYGII
jgi:hypothetical protein